jgi:hypothetical protein
MSAAPRITDHATTRWADRVANGSSPARAREEIAQFVATGRVRPTPRSWMTGVKPAPGVAFLYSASFPGVCGIVTDGAVVTFVTRELCRGNSRASARSMRRAPRHGRGRRDAHNDRDTRAALRVAQRAFSGRTSRLGQVEEVAA